MNWIATYNRYRDLSARLCNRYRDRLVAADGNLPHDAAFAMAHNWGNPAAKVVLAKYQTRSLGLLRREARECRMGM